MATTDEEAQNLAHRRVRSVFVYNIYDLFVIFSGDNFEAIKIAADGDKSVTPLFVEPSSIAQYPAK